MIKQAGSQHAISSVKYSSKTNLPKGQRLKCLGFRDMPQTEHSLDFIWICDSALRQAAETGYSEGHLNPFESLYLIVFVCFVHTHSLSCTYICFPLSFYWVFLHVSGVTLWMFAGWSSSCPILTRIGCVVIQICTGTVAQSGVILLINVTIAPTPAYQTASCETSLFKCSMLKHHFPFFMVGQRDSHQFHNLNFSCS